MPEPISNPPPPPAMREPILLPALARLGRFIHKITRREHYMNTLRSLVWVIPLTVVIWIYAEREQQFTSPPVSFSFEVKSNDPHYVVTVRQDNNIEAELTGPRAAVDEVIRHLHTEGSAVAPVTIIVDPKSAGTSLNTYDQIYNKAIFNDLGVSVEKEHVFPTTLPIDVDELKEVDVPVKAPPGLKDLESAVFEPATVKVRAPARALAAFEKAGSQPFVYAAIADLDVVKQPGPHVVNSVAVTWPNGDTANILFTPSTVKASIVVKQADVEYVIGSVPVYLLTPFGLLDQYHVGYNPTIKNVTIIGEADKIDQVRRDEQAGKVTIRAMLPITNADLPGSEISRVPRYDLPDGVRVNDDDAKRQVAFTLTSRTAGP